MIRQRYGVTPGTLPIGRPSLVLMAATPMAVSPMNMNVKLPFVGLSQPAHSLKRIWRRCHQRESRSDCLPESRLPHYR